MSRIRRPMTLEQVRDELAMEIAALSVEQAKTAQKLVRTSRELCELERRMGRQLEVA